MVEVIEETEKYHHVKILKLPHCKYPPTSAHRYDAGLDLYYNGTETIHIGGGGQDTLDSGIAVEIPIGWCGIIQNRSGALCRGDFTVDGTVDAGYRGEVKIIVHARHGVTLKPGDKLAQIVFVPHLVAFGFVNELPPGDRGDKGFGSTG